MDAIAINTTDISYETGNAFQDSSIGGGLIALGFLALTSILSTVGLVGFITYRIVFWRDHYKSSIATNQYILLIISLLCADLIQALSFVCSFFWYAHEPIGSNRHWCTAQGVMIHLGDVASAFFVLAIALHTWYQVGMGRKLDEHTFVGIMIFIWGFSIILTIIAPAMHGNDVYTASGAWCWIDEQYEALRLGTHYAFIFMIEFAGLLIYGLLFLKLRRSRNAISKMSPAYDSLNDKRITHAARLMAVYPIVYMVLTAPLAISRMALYGNAPVPEGVWITAGCLMTSSGWVDSLLYVFTRRALLRETRRPSLGDNSGSDSYWSERKPSRTASELESLKSRSAVNLVPAYVNSDKNVFFPDRSVENLAKLRLAVPPPIRPGFQARPCSERTIATMYTMKQLPKTPTLENSWDDESPIVAKTLSPFSPLSKPQALPQLSHSSPTKSSSSRASSRHRSQTRDEPTKERSLSRSTTIRSTTSQPTHILNTIFRKSDHGRSRASSPTAFELPGDMTIVVEKEVNVQSRRRSDMGLSPSHIRAPPGGQSPFEASVPWAGH